jgi:hypothetical protein
MTIADGFSEDINRLFQQLGRCNARLSSLEKITLPFDDRLKNLTDDGASFSTSTNILINKCITDITKLWDEV